MPLVELHSSNVYQVDCCGNIKTNTPPRTVTVRTIDNQMMGNGWTPSRYRDPPWWQTNNFRSRVNNQISVLQNDCTGSRVIVYRRCIITCKNFLVSESSRWQCIRDLALPLITDCAAQLANSVEKTKTWFCWFWNCGSCFGLPNSDLTPSPA